MTDPRVLLLPGWQNSGPDHWQTRWERRYGDERVQQHDWDWPRRGDWMSQLEEAVLRSERPVVLAAHSLGCLLVAAWAAHSAHTRRVRGALLVALPDAQRADLPVPVQAWRPIVRQRLPFASTVVVSSNDTFCAPERARAIAGDWGARVVEAGPAGHINAESGLGDWPAGRALLDEFLIA